MALRSDLPDMETLIRFGQGQSGNEYLVAGWGTPEDGFVWSGGRYARIAVPGLGQATSLRLSLWGYAPRGANDPQEALIFVNGLFAGCIKTLSKEVYTFKIQGTSREALVVDFYIPSAKCPDDYEHNGDKRVLGIALATLLVSR
jgi:hypothetical protein